MSKIKRKLNSLEQEILIQEELTIASEINRLELEIANNNSNVVQNNRLRFWTFFFSGFILSAIAIYTLIIISIGDLIGLSFEFQRFLLILSSISLVVFPIFNVIIWTVISLHIRNKNAAYIRANKVMLVRLEKYYRLLKFELDPEKYKIWDDSFVVDIDENGNLVKYIRFYNSDGTITTKPFVDTRQVREFLDNNDAQERIKAENKRLLEKANKFKQATNNFNSFNLIDNNIQSKSVIEDSNINVTRFVGNTDYFPEQYENKVSKWYTKDEFNDAQDFKQVLSRSIIDQATENGDNVVVNASWLNEQFDDKEKASNSFFKSYDITKSCGKDVQQFVNIVRNFDLEKDPSINWEDTIDPKDFNKEKLALYNNAIKEREEKALQLTLEQLALEASLKSNSKKVLRVALVDDVGIDTYRDQDPYKEIKKELDKQQKRANEIAKTKALFLEHGFEDVNYEGLSVQEIKKLVKIKIKEREELEKLSKKENMDEVVALENEISRIKGEKFKEVHLPNEKYQNEDGLWEYYDSDGQYFICSPEGEWSPAESAEIRFEENKANRINKLQKKFNEDQERRLQEQQKELDRKQKEIEDASSIASEREFKISNKKKLAKEMKKQSKEDMLHEKQQLEEFKKIQKQKEDEYQKQFEKEENKIDHYIETHPANEAFMHDDGKWMYHDGEGNYFVSNEEGEWIPSEAPKIVKKQDDSLISPWEKDNKENNASNEDNEPDKKTKKQLKKEAKEKAKQEKLMNKEKTEDNPPVDGTTMDATAQAYGNQNQEYNYQNDQMVNGQDQTQQTVAQEARQWQDETTGVWWYMDEQGNYFYADENGNWVPYSS